MESKVEKYIQDYTRNCSNEITQYYSDLEKHYHPWLTPEHAREVAKIAREEATENACKWLDEHLLDYWSQSHTDNCDFIEDFKEAMEE